MRQAFVDTVFWVAVLDPRDNLHANAVGAASRLAGTQLVTSELVLVETLNTFCAAGPHLRTASVQMIERLRTQPNLRIVPQTTQLFDAAFSLFSSRLDKNWSFVDCTSFVLMGALGISEALTYDEHFLQAGYLPLLRRYDR
jgi:predicted nucleic acid-binding protein